MCNLAFLKISHICLEVILTMILHLLIESMSDGALKNVLSLRFCPFESEAGTI